MIKSNQTHSWTEAELAGLAGGSMLRVMREVERLGEEMREAGAHILIKHQKAERVQKSLSSCKGFWRVFFPY